MSEFPYYLANTPKPSVRLMGKIDAIWSPCTLVVDTQADLIVLPQKLFPYVSTVRDFPEKIDPRWAKRLSGFADAELELTSLQRDQYRWNGYVGLWPYDWGIFGYWYGLRLFNFKNRPHDRIMEFEPNPDFDGEVTEAPIDDS